jgi:hypothetical protein
MNALWVDPWPPRITVGSSRCVPGPAPCNVTLSCSLSKHIAESRNSTGAAPSLRRASAIGVHHGALFTESGTTWIVCATVVLPPGPDRASSNVSVAGASSSGR